MAGDSAPVDIIAHLPGLCEDSGISYAFIKSKQDLGSAVLSKRPCCAVMVLEPKEDSEVHELYTKVAKAVKRANKE